MLVAMSPFCLADDDASSATAAVGDAIKLYDEGKLDEAQAAFETNVKANPSDTISRRYIRSILSIKRKMAHMDENVLERDRILDVRRAWIPIDRSGEAQDKNSAGGGNGALASAVRERVKQVIPQIDFTDAQIRDVLSYLSKVGGINMVFDEGGNGDVSKALASRITIALNNVPLSEALKYILSAKGLTFRLDDYAIVISSPSRLKSVEMETRYYHLSSGNGTFSPHKFGADKKGFDTEDSFEASQDTDSEADAVTTASLTIKDVLEQSGVPFPSGSKIFLDQRTGVLLVRNTPGNLAIIEKIISALDVTPYQVAIEAKFVDVVESAARELGLEAFLTGDFGVTKQGGINDLTIHSDANNPVFGQYRTAGDGRGGISKGIRFLSEATNANNPAGNIFSFAQTLTQPQFQVVLHALEQSGMANVLSAPKITTVNNQEARIEVVTEIIYPSTYEVTAATTSAVGAVITPGVAIPGGFVTRDTGVILTVTPSVGTDTKVISLGLKPEVSALSSWNNFGIAAGPGALGSNAIPILQPVFTTQTVSTNVMVRDGETVVLGGLIREVTDTRDDKIPILGDIPGIGRAFRNESETTSKRNLLIFVTAYLLTPDGQTVRTPRYPKAKIFNP